MQDHNHEKLHPPPIFDLKKADINQFYSYVEALMASYPKKLESIVLINIEIDNIEFILRIFGPGVRNELITSVGKIIAELIPPDISLFHINQFRFAVVATDIEFNQAITLVERLIEHLEAAITIEKNTLYAHIKIGICQFPNNAEDVNELVRKAAFASHTAKEEKKSYAIYNQQKDDWEKHQFRLLTNFKTALETNDELRIALQPIVCLKSGKCVSAESLIRWNHPELGNIPPNHFLPYVEQSVLITPFTEFSISATLKAHTLLAKSGYEGSLSINLSTMVFRLNTLFSKISELIGFYNVKPEQITFEITETAIMEHPKSAIYTLNQLREIGCKISIDDFGTGHSSLAYLADLPVNVIKIDQYFIQDIERSSNQAIISTTATLAEKLGMKTVAEGIETQLQFETCKELGVNYGQGYFFSKPVFKEQFDKWLKKNTHSNLQLVENKVN